MRTRKIFGSLLLFVLLALPLCACKPAEDPNQTISVDGPLNTSGSLADSPFVGTFRNSYNARFASLAQDVFELEDEIPVLVAGSDGRFSLTIVDTENTGLAYTLTGSFTVDGDAAVFTADGDTEPWFTMNLISADEMSYSGRDYYCVSQGDIFERI